MCISDTQPNAMLIQFYFQGSRFALMEVKSVIYHLLLHFKFEPNEKTQIPINISKQPFGMTSEKGVNLRLALRKQN